QLAGANRLRVRADRFRCVGTRDRLFHAAFVILPERRQRVQTRMRRTPPAIIARTVCRFGSNRRALTLFAWLFWRPTTGVLPQISHFFAMNQLQLSAIQVLADSC